MAARGAAAVGGARGRGSGSTRGRVGIRGARDNQVARQHVTRAALRLNLGLRTPERLEHQHAAPGAVPPNVPEEFMQMMRNNYATLRRQLEEERQKGIPLEAQIAAQQGGNGKAQGATPQDGNESTDNSDDSDYEVEEEDQSEEESLFPEEEEGSAGE